MCMRLGPALGSLAEALIRRGVELVGVCGSDVSDTAMTDWPMDVIRFPTRRWFKNRRAVASLAEKLRARGVRLLHGMDAEAGLTTSLLAVELNCPHVVSSYCLGDGRIVDG